MARPVTEVRSKNLHFRIFSALALIPPVLGVTYLGYPYFNILVGVAAALMAWEWSNMVGGGRLGYDGWILIVGLSGALTGGSYGIYIQSFLALGLVGLILFMITQVRRLTLKLPIHSEQMDQAIGPRRASWLAAGAFYIGVPTLSLIWIRADWDNGLLAVIWLLVLVWSADSGAYIAGRLIGGPKMAPNISPNKTWAGLGGCVVAAAVAGVLVAKAAGIESYGMLKVLMVSAFVGLVSQGGDLVESAVKRHFSVKDSSHLIPGHGGVLDRVDALLAAITATALIGYLS